MRGVAPGALIALALAGCILPEVDGPGLDGAPLSSVYVAPAAPLPAAADACDATKEFVGDVILTDGGPAPAATLAKQCKIVGKVSLETGTKHAERLRWVKIIEGDLLVASDDSSVLDSALPALERVTGKLSTPPGDCRLPDLKKLEQVGALDLLECKEVNAGSLGQLRRAGSIRLSNQPKTSITTLAALEVVDQTVEIGPVEHGKAQVALQKLRQAGTIVVRDSKSVRSVLLNSLEKVGSIVLTRMNDVEFVFLEDLASAESLHFAHLASFGEFPKTKLVTLAELQLWDLPELWRPDGLTFSVTKTLRICDVPQLAPDQVPALASSPAKVETSGCSD